MANTRSWSVIAAAFAALVLTACGGEGELGGTTGSTTGGDPGDPVPTKLILLASSPQLASDAEDVGAGVTLTAIIRDANNNVIPGVTVLFATPDSAEINVTNPAVTDGNGRVSAVVTTGGDPENRTIRVTAVAATSETTFLQSTVTIQILGTTLNISGPSTTQFGTPTEFTVLLTDAENQGIPGTTVELSTDPGNTLSASTLVTDVSGQVKVNLTVQRAESTLTVNALGLTASQTVTASPDQFELLPLASTAAACLSPAREVFIDCDQAITASWLRNGQPVVGQTINFAATRGSFKNQVESAKTGANGRATVILTSAQAGFSTVTASSQALTQPSISAPVEFVARTPFRVDVQAGPSSVPPTQSSEITAVVRDRNNNLVKNVTVEFSLVDSTSGTLSSPTAVTNGQGLARINYTATSQSSASADVVITGRVRGTEIRDSVNLTVGGRAVSIFLGTGSEILIKDESTYQMTYTVVVSDTAGNPVPDAEFRLTLQPTFFYKGTRTEPSAECSNEDVNLNDILEAGEDLNGNGRLDPGRIAVLPASIDLDADGAGQFLVTYPKDVGGFVEVLIIATATVAGSETQVRRRFVLPIAEDDVENLPFESPFGLGVENPPLDPLVTPFRDNVRCSYEDF